MLQNLDVQMRLYLGSLATDAAGFPTGPSYLELTSGPYDLEAGTVADVATSWRRKTVDNPHVEGTYTIHAERENSTVPLNVWVEAENRDALQGHVNALVAGISQLEFLIYFRIGEAEQAWRCEVSDYTTDTQHAFLHAKMALVKVNLVRRPKVRYR